MIMSKSDFEMLTSIFCYDSKDSEYYDNLVKKYGAELVENTYKTMEEKWLVVKGTYTDCEGVSYNKLVLKEICNYINELVNLELDKDNLMYNTIEEDKEAYLIDYMDLFEKEENITIENKQWYINELRGKLCLN